MRLFIHPALHFSIHSTPQNITRHIPKIKMYKASFLLLVDSAFSAILPRKQLPYPEVRRNESVIDNYYGRLITDPYRHLEDLNSQETLDFIQAQNDFTNSYLQHPQRDQMKAAFTQSYNYSRHGVPRPLGGNNYLFSLNTGLQDQTVWYIQQGLEGTPHIFLDPNEYSDDGSIALSQFSFSPDGSIAALALNQYGSDWTTIRFRNMSSGQYLTDLLENIKLPSIIWSSDCLGIFYNAYQNNDSYSINNKIYYHRLDSSQRDDVIVTEFDNPFTLPTYRLSSDGKYLILYTSSETTALGLYYADMEGVIVDGRVARDLNFIPLEDSNLFLYQFVGNDLDLFYFVTNKDAPNSHLVSVNISHQPLEWNVVVPEDEHVLEAAFEIDSDKMLLRYMVHVTHQLEIRKMDLNGTFLQSIPLPPYYLLDFSGGKSSNELFLQISSFIIPAITYRIDLNQFPFELENFREVVHPGFNPDDYISSRVFFPSYDGTSIPLIITHKKDLPRDGNQSVILYGYGGFNSVIPPIFGADKAVFLRDFNGIYVSSHVRGGGEYGGKWHDDGRLLKKQNGFDDFQAAAEYLIGENYTNSKRLIIQGGSNGGVLVGACTNQRPDLYAGVINEMGVLDLLRYQLFDISYRGCAEYGCSDDGNQTIFENLLRLSPLHNVRMKEDGQYPAVFVITADHDDRVAALNSYKLVAELQYRIGREERQTNPLLLKVRKNTGHAYVGKPIMMRVEELAEMYTFFVKEAGFVFAPSAN